MGVSVVAQENKPLTIGFAQVGSESAWRVAFTNATLAEAEARGINLLFSDGENNQDTQIAALRFFIQQKVDAIILAPVVETGWNTVLQEIKDANIPLVIIDRNITADSSSYITRVASDFMHEGRLAAAWLVQQTSGDCNIIELEGTPGSSAARDRQIGFNQIISYFPNMRIILSQSGNFTRNGGREIMETILLTENIDAICAIWAHNDDMAIGAIDAMRMYGVDAGEDILTVSVDAIPDIFLYMMQGDANATVELSPYMAAPAFDAIYAYLNGETIPRLIPVLGRLYLPDTAAEEYARRTQ
ncbi:MAG: sugar ABC transporter substrate-binding protein [Phototrophicales bacterium]|nr:MAG: sugar ABC transporter substrate-binding protein [Phototrophicales bacterium]